MFCTVCDKYVEERTKHCGACNRCCFEFDHHCEWLNNCIGKSNYKAFLALIAWLMVYLILDFLLIVAMFETGHMSPKHPGSGRRSWYAVCVYIELAMAVVTFLFVLQLNVYHVWLARKGMTTYDHIAF